MLSEQESLGVFVCRNIDVTAEIGTAVVQPVMVLRTQ